MELKIQRAYFVPGLRTWLNEKKKACLTCNLVTKPSIMNPSAALLPEKPCIVWQVDHIGKFPPDSKTGHRYKNNFFFFYCTLTKHSNTGTL